MSLSLHGESLRLQAPFVAFVVGIAIGLVPMPRWARIIALMSAPVVALIVGIATRPDPDCHYDCSDNGAWGFIIVPIALVFWYLGNGLGLTVTSLVRGALRHRAGSLSERR